MILTCPACQTRYEVDATSFPPQGRNVRCARCSHVWHADAEIPPAAEPEPAPPPQEAYAQPEPRDPEPQERESFEETAPEPGVKLWQRPWFLKAGWGALIAIVILIAWIATVYRHQVVETWPQSASVYSKLGMKVPAGGLKLDNTRNSRELRNGRLVLTVSGALTNVTDRELPVPQIRIGLIDNDKREVYHWTVAPDVITLKPGQSTRFVTRLSNPPEGVSEVRIAKAE